jgi:hypothetical protein
MGNVEQEPYGIDETIKDLPTILAVYGAIK